MNTRKNQHHWVTYEGKPYTLRSLCLHLDRDYPNTHKKIRHQTEDDLSWAFLLPEGSVTRYHPSKEELSELKRANRMKAKKSVARTDRTPSAVSRFLTGARP